MNQCYVKMWLMSRVFPESVDETGSSSTGCCVITPRMKSNQRIQPIFVPEDEIYIDLRPQRCLRVIHRTGDTFYPHVSVDVKKNEDDSSDDEEYWFETASPRRPKIQKKHSIRKSEKKRIFHKFEPQAKRKFPPVTNSSNIGAPTGSSGGRLTRKTIKVTLDDDVDDDDDDDVDDLPCTHEKFNEAKSQEVVSRQLEGHSESSKKSKLASNTVVGPALENHSDLILNITADSTKLKRKKFANIKNQEEDTNQSLEEMLTNVSDPEMKGNLKVQAERPTSPDDSSEKAVLTSPDPESLSGQRSRSESPKFDDEIDHPIIDGIGSNLGGVANVGFEDDEDNAEW